MSLEAVLANIEAHNHELVSRATWGHLAPVRNKTYRGRVVYAVGCLGNDPNNPTVISFEFGSLANSPWFDAALHEFIGGGEAPPQHARCMHDGSYMVGGLRNEPGCVYEWNGTMRNYVFKGQRTLLINTNA